jgi:hypothetical protein
VTTERERDCEPELPHEAVQLDQTPKELTLQWVGHMCSLQLRASRRFGHSTPPKLTSVMMLRVRSCEPPPHDAVHVDQALYSDSTQSSGQLLELQSRDSSRYGHT